MIITESKPEYVLSAVGDVVTAELATQYLLSHTMTNVIGSNNLPEVIYYDVDDSQTPSVANSGSFLNWANGVLTGIDEWVGQPQEVTSTTTPSDLTASMALTYSSPNGVTDYTVSSGSVAEWQYVTTGSISAGVINQGVLPHGASYTYYGTGQTGGLDTILETNSSSPYRTISITGNNGLTASITLTLYDASGVVSASCVYTINRNGIEITSMVGSNTAYYANCPADNSASVLGQFFNMQAMPLSGYELYTLSDGMTLAAIGQQDYSGTVTSNQPSMLPVPGGEFVLPSPTITTNYTGLSVLLTPNIAGVAEVSGVLAADTTTGLITTVLPLTERHSAGDEVSMMIRAVSYFYGNDSYGNVVSFPTKIVLSNQTPGTDTIVQSMRTVTLGTDSRGIQYMSEMT